jgi:hypothetical protein
MAIQATQEKQFTNVRYVAGKNGMNGYWIRRCNSCGQQMVVSKHAESCHYIRKRLRLEQQRIVEKGFLF